MELAHLLFSTFPTETDLIIVGGSPILWGYLLCRPWLKSPRWKERIRLSIRLAGWIKSSQPHLPEPVGPFNSCPCDPAVFVCQDCLEKEKITSLSSPPDSIAVSLFVDIFVDFDKLNQKQIQITIWLWDEQACLFPTQLYQVNPWVPSLRSVNLPAPQQEF